MACVVKKVLLLLCGQGFQRNIGFIGDVQFYDRGIAVVFGCDMEQSRDGIIHAENRKNDGTVLREDIRGGMRGDRGDQEIVLNGNLDLLNF